MNKVNFEELDFKQNTYQEMYKGRPFSGIAYEYTIEGNSLTEVRYKDGYKDGLARYWFSTGQMEREVNFKENCGHGLFKEWNSNGELVSEGESEFGICVWQKDYDENGDLKGEYYLKPTDSQYEILSTIRKRHTINVK